MNGQCRFTRLLAVVGVTATLVAGACSVSTNEEPVAAGNIFQDFVESTTTTTSPTPPEAETKLEPVYFLRTNGGAARLVPVDREFDLDADVGTVLTDLFTRPPDTDGDERPTERGMTSQITDSAILVTAELSSSDPNELIVDLTGVFGSLDGSPLRNALAQIVWTATSPPDIQRVSFRRDGDPVGAIIGNGETVERAVDRADYTSLN